MSEFNWRAELDRCEDEHDLRSFAESAVEKIADLTTELGDARALVAAWNQWARLAAQITQD